MNYIILLLQKYMKRKLDNMKCVIAQFGTNTNKFSPIVKVGSVSFPQKSSRFQLFYKVKGRKLPSSSILFLRKLRNTSPVFVNVLIKFTMFVQELKKNFTLIFKLCTYDRTFDGIEIL